ncbi:MAG: CheR family methyltransferase [Candidatus Electrothrix sp. YB6]
MNVPDKTIEETEITLLLQGIFLRYGYDFRNYAKASITRRVKQFLEKTGCATAGVLLARVLREPALFQQLLIDFSITVTEMFRDPSFYRAVRKEIVPLLKTYPFIRIWLAGCATGEEAYSMAILLQEEELLDKATIFATDINDQALAKAKKGIFPLKQVRNYTENHQASGSAESFSRYYHADHEYILIDSELRSSITFANHNLVSDQVFGEMHLILCRNVMIYFDRKLRDRVLNLFDESLIRGGFLCLGAKESLRFSDIFARYTRVDEKNRIYRKQIVQNTLRNAPAHR